MRGASNFCLPEAKRWRRTLPSCTLNKVLIGAEYSPQLDF